MLPTLEQSSGEKREPPCQIGRNLGVKMVKKLRKSEPVAGKKGREKGLYPITAGSSWASKDRWLRHHRWLKPRLGCAPFTVGPNGSDGHLPLGRW